MISYICRIAFRAHFQLSFFCACFYPWGPYLPVCKWTRRGGLRRWRPSWAGAGRRRGGGGRTRPLPRRWRAAPNFSALPAAAAPTVLLPAWWLLLSVPRPHRKPLRIKYFKNGVHGVYAWIKKRISVKDNQVPVECTEKEGFKLVRFLNSFGGLKRS